MICVIGDQMTMQRHSVRAKQRVERKGGTAQQSRKARRMLLFAKDLIYVGRGVPRLRASSVACVQLRHRMLRGFRASMEINNQVPPHAPFELLNPSRMLQHTKQRFDSFDRICLPPQSLSLSRRCGAKYARVPMGGSGICSGDKQCQMS